MQKSSTLVYVCANMKISGVIDKRIKAYRRMGPGFDLHDADQNLFLVGV